MLNFFKKDYKRNDKNLDLKPFMKNWEFAMDRSNALKFSEKDRWHVVCHFIVKYILSIRYGCDSFSVPWGVFLSGSVFNHNTLRDGAYVDTDFLQTIQILERDKKGVLYRAITVDGDSYYFRSEDSSESFDEIVGKATKSLDRIMAVPNPHVVPLVILPKED